MLFTSPVRRFTSAPLVAVSLIVVATGCNDDTGVLVDDGVPVMTGDSSVATTEQSGAELKSLQPLTGTWKYTPDDGTVEVRTFNADGTFEWQTDGQTPGSRLTYAGDAKVDQGRIRYYMKSVTDDAGETSEYANIMEESVMAFGPDTLKLEDRNWKTNTFVRVPSESPATSEAAAPAEKDDQPETANPAL